MTQAAPADSRLDASRATPRPLGQYITSQKRGIFDRIVLVPLIGTFLLMALFGLLVSIYEIAADRMYVPGIIGAVFSAVVLWACVMGVRMTFRRVDFYDSAAVERCLGRKRVYQYAEISELVFGLKQQRAHGLNAGMQYALKARLDDGRKLIATGSYWESAEPCQVEALGGTFTGPSPLDVVRDIIAAYIAPRLAEQLQEKGAIAWGSAAISYAGITPTEGRRQGELIGWDQIAEVSHAGGDTIVMVAAGDMASFLAVSASSPNFAPFMRLISALSGGRVAWGWNG